MTKRQQARYARLNGGLHSDPRTGAERATEAPESSTTAPVGDWLKRIPDGMIPCYVCHEYVKQGEGHCGIVTCMSTHPWTESI